MLAVGNGDVRIRRCEHRRDNIMGILAGAETAAGTAAQLLDSLAKRLFQDAEPRDYETAQFVESATGRQTFVLNLLANEGRTILEKFEEYANLAAFAVVLLTADDEGRVRGEGELRPRGRQNVVFELGFFFGRLGRGRVIVLADPTVEYPSDIAGLAIIVFDNREQWKSELTRELAAAGLGPAAAG
jgi:hypothetical protein